jgi:hypothetical protein
MGLNQREFRQGIPTLVNIAAESVLSYLSDRETSFLLTNIRISIKQDLPELEIGSYKLQESHENESLDVPRWVAESLREMGFADIQEEPFDVELFRALSRERIAGPLQLSTLRSDFFLKLRHYFRSLKSKLESNPQAKLELDKLSVSAYDLVTLRTSKILQLAASSSAPKEVVEKITPEEKALFHEVHNLVNSWRNALVQGAKYT